MTTYRRLGRAILGLIVVLLMSFATVADASQKTVHVKGYHKKDGTYVEGHDRKAPSEKKGEAKEGTKKKGDTPAASKPAPKTSAATQPRDEKGRFVRNESAKREFMQKSGYPKGRPGYVVDHVVPLACGGADAASNMQWQTVAEGKAKDKVERKGCR